MLHTAIAIPMDTIAEICRRRGIARLELFGSVLRSDFSADRSDVDLLVEFLPEAAPSLFDLVEIEDELAAAFGGRRVDLVVKSSLSRWIRRSVLDQAKVLYAAT